MTPAVRAAVLLGMLQAGPVEYASAVSTTGTGASAATVTKPSGLEVGDVVFVLLGYTDNLNPTLTTTSGATWSKATILSEEVGDQQAAYLFSRILTQTDIANSWELTSSGSSILAVHYRGKGATAVSVKSSSMDTTSSRVLTGFSKSVNTYGVISFLAAGGSPASPSVPSGFTARYNALISGGQRAIVADNMSSYVDGASATWGSLAGGNMSVAALVEVTGE